MRARVVMAVLGLAVSVAAAGAPPDPEALGWDVRIAGPSEPGDPLVLTGTIYMADGVTPAEAVILYAFHTNKDGIYPGRGEAEGDAYTDGTIRAWLRTGKDGRYRITTIRPGSYPGSRVPQHIHATVTPPGGEEVGIPDFHFADDPFLGEETKSRAASTGAGNIVTLTKGDDGVWRGKRDIILGG